MESEPGFGQFGSDTRGFFGKFRSFLGGKLSFQRFDFFSPIQSFFGHFGIFGKQRSIGRIFGIFSASAK